MPSSDLKFEIGHVLFMDIVGYSKLVIDEQTERTRKLNEITRNAPQFRLAEAEGTLVRLPTGDGIALIFRNHSEAPAQCALEISTALRAHPEIEIRMGIHSGPVNQTQDVNDRANIAGAGINLAQRVMDCGDAGHILVSKRVADDLDNYARWQPRLHDLGEAEVKHGVRVHLVNLFGDGFGNPELPGRFKQAEKVRTSSARRKRNWQLIGFTIVLAVLAAAGFWLRLRPPSRTPPVAISPAIPEKSIAVLPFENLSAEKDDAFFADGIQDDVLASLGRIKDLKVIGRASVMLYRGVAVAGKLREIGQALQVSHVLQGSVRRSLTRVVINVALIDTRNDNQVWSQHYDRTLVDTLSLQGELAIEIARELRATLTPVEKNAAEKKPTDNPEAYLAYLHGRENENRFFAKQPEYDAAEKFYQQAVDLDPEFALAHASLSGMVSFNHRREGKDKARAEAQTALRLQPELGEGHLAMADYFRRCEADFDQSLYELSLASAFLPNSPDVARATGRIHLSQRKWREALEDFERAARLDPDNAQLLHYDLALTYRDARNWSAALRARTRLSAVLEKQKIPDIGNVGRAIDEFYATSSVTPMRNSLNLIEADKETEPNDLNLIRYVVTMLERNYPAAEQALTRVPPEFLVRLEFPSKTTLQAMIQLARREPAERIAATLTPDLKKAQEEVAKTADDWDRHSSLGVLLALAGRKEDAIREGLRGAELANPRFKDPALANLAFIYARTDKADEAVKLLETLLTRPGLVNTTGIVSITLADLRLQPQWDPLRNNAQFKKLVAGPEPVTVY